MQLPIRVMVFGVILLGIYGLVSYRHIGESESLAQPGFQRKAPPKAELDPNAAPNIVRQGFPAAGSDPDDLTKSETAWEIEWELTHPTNRRPDGAR